MLPLLMARNGLSGLRYNYRDVSPQERDEGLMDGSLRAVTGFDATIVFSLQARGVSADKLGFLYFADLGMDIYSASVLCSQAIGQDRVLSDNVRRIFTTAWNDCRSNPELGVEAVCRRLPDANRTLVRRHLEWVLTHQVFPEDCETFGSFEIGKANRSLEIARALAGAPKRPFDMDKFFPRDGHDSARGL